MITLIKQGAKAILSKDLFLMEIEGITGTEYHIEYKPDYLSEKIDEACEHLVNNGFNIAQ